MTELAITFTVASCFFRLQHFEPAGLTGRICTRRHSSTRCLGTSSGSSPRFGRVGSQRVEEALPGTYWSDSAEVGNEILVAFNKGSETVTAKARVGENLLRVAERSGIMIPNADFCFEGSCCHCEMEVVGGASEVSFGATERVDELVRSCICPVPSRKKGLEVNLINEDDVWGERVL